jgi:hypothetical protein
MLCSRRFALDALKGLRRHFVVSREFKVVAGRSTSAAALALDARFLSQIAQTVGVLSVEQFSRLTWLRTTPSILARSCYSFE